jgi:hypothetical protein
MKGTTMKRTLTLLAVLLLVPLAALHAADLAAPAAPSLGLSVQDGVLVRNGRPYRGIGVNYFNAFAVSIATAAEDPHDLVVYGGTSGGIVAAVQAARSGHTVVLISPTQKLGGLTASGLGMTDTAGYRQIIGGLAREFYHRIGQHYSDPRNWCWGDRDTYLKKHGPNRDGMMLRFEPHVAGKVCQPGSADEPDVVQVGIPLSAMRAQEHRPKVGDPAPELPVQSTR